MFIISSRSIFFSLPTRQHLFYQKCFISLALSFSAIDHAVWSVCIISPETDSSTRKICFLPLSLYSFSLHLSGPTPTPRSFSVSTSASLSSPHSVFISSSVSSSPTQRQTHDWLEMLGRMESSSPSNRMLKPVLWLGWSVMNWTRTAGPSLITPSNGMGPPLAESKSTTEPASRPLHNTNLERSRFTHTHTQICIHYCSKVCGHLEFCK